MGEYCYQCKWRREQEEHCENCRWFNKNGFAPGFGDCTLHREVHSANHEACEHYEECEPQQHGEWIYNQYDGNPNIGNWHCSECRHIVIGGYSQKPHLNFCPNCGAYMQANARQVTDKLN